MAAPAMTPVASATPTATFSFSPSALVQHRFFVLVILLILSAVIFWIAFQYYTTLTKDLAQAREQHEEIKHQLQEARQILSLMGPPSFDMMMEDTYQAADAKRPSESGSNEQQQPMMSPLLFMMNPGKSETLKASIEELGDDTAAVEKQVDEEDEEPQQKPSTAAEALQGILGTQPAKKTSKKRKIDDTK